MQDFEIGVFYHVFYEDSLEAILEELKFLKTKNTIFFFNIVETTPGKESIKETLKDAFKNSIFIFSSDKGKDIGGKLLLLSIFHSFKINVKYLLFLHDKKSLHALNSKNWRSGLLRIVREDQLKLILNLFETVPSIGIIASNPYILKEKVDSQGFVGRNAEILSFLTGKYSVMTANSQYVAGTMFWARAKPFQDFFNLFNPLEIRSCLEEGNVLDNFSGTYTHSWERMLSWIVTGKGYKIKGV